MNSIYSTQEQRPVNLTCEVTENITVKKKWAPYLISITLLGSHSHAIHLKPFVLRQIIVLTFPAFPSLPRRCLTRQKRWKTMNSLEWWCLQYDVFFVCKLLIPCSRMAIWITYTILLFQSSYVFLCHLKEVFIFLQLH